MTQELKSERPLWRRLGCSVE